MAKDLWELRKQRKLTVKQLAAKSGVAASNIYAYESGELVKLADMEKLARALYVSKADIKFQSDPIPKTKPKPPPPPPKPAAQPPTTSDAAAPAKAAPAAKPAKKTHQPQMATEGQLNHLRDLATKLGQDETAVTERLGKPLTELTFKEARIWLKSFDGEVKAQKDGERPPGTRRWRAPLPEGVDEFEANYLLARQEAGDVVTFTLLDERELQGKIIGFSPYTITIEQADGAETTIQKLALAYYTVVPQAEAMP